MLASQPPPSQRDRFVVRDETKRSLGLMIDLQKLQSVVEVVDVVEGGGHCARQCLLRVRIEWNATIRRYFMKNSSLS